MINVLRMSSLKLPNWKLCAISPSFCPFTTITPKSPVNFGMCWKLSASKRGKNTESKNTHKPHKTTITKAGAGSAMPDGKTGEQNPSKITSKVSHRQLRKIRGFPGYPEAPIWGKLCYSFSSKPSPCSFLDSRALLGFRDPGEAAAANFPSATLNLKAAPKKLWQRSHWEKKFQLFPSSSPWKRHNYSQSAHEQTRLSQHQAGNSKHIFIKNTSVHYHNLFLKTPKNPSRILSHFWQVAECLYLC